MDSVAEEWRVVAEYPTYMISNFGNMKTNRRRNGRNPGVRLSEDWLPIAVKPSPFGYRNILLANEQGKRRKAVYRLVLETFVGPCPEGMEACHCDGNSSNDRLDNLRWDTHASNLADRVIHGTAPVGEKSGMAKTTDEQMIEICHKMAAGAKLREVSKEYGLSIASISKFLCGENWTHLWPKVQDIFPLHSRPSAKWKRKKRLSPEDKQLAKEMLLSGLYERREVAAKFDISVAATFGITSWKPRTGKPGRKKQNRSV